MEQPCILESTNSIGEQNHPWTVRRRRAVTRGQAGVGSFYMELDDIGGWLLYGGVDVAIVIREGGMRKSS